MSRRRHSGGATRASLAPLAGEDSMLRTPKVKLQEDEEVMEMGARDKKSDDVVSKGQEVDGQVRSTFPLRARLPSYSTRAELRIDVEGQESNGAAHRAMCVPSE